MTKKKVVAKVAAKESANYQLRLMCVQCGAIRVTDSLSREHSLSDLETTLRGVPEYNDFGYGQCVDCDMTTRQIMVGYY